MGQPWRKMHGPGSIKMTVLDGGRGIPARQSAVGCKGSVPDKSVGCLARHGVCVIWRWNSRQVSTGHRGSRRITCQVGSCREMCACRGLGDEAGARLCLQRTVVPGCWRADLSRGSQKTGRRFQHPALRANEGWSASMTTTRSATPKCEKWMGVAEGHVAAAMSCCLEIAL